MLAKLLYETALLESGFQLSDVKGFNGRVYNLVKDVLKIEEDLTAGSQASQELGRVSCFQNVFHRQYWRVLKWLTLFYMKRYVDIDVRVTTFRQI